MKTAIVYDRVNKWGGAERVLLALHEMFPEAPLYTSVYDEKRAPWAKVFPKVIPSFLQKIPFMQRRHEILAFLMPVAFETLDFSGYDLVISVTSEAAKGIITKPGTFHICYCLTPTRYLWSHCETYLQGLTLQAVTKPIVSYLRAWDRIASQRPDVMVAISTEVQMRIKRYYDRDPGIIFPPVEIVKFQTPKPRLRGHDYGYPDIAYQSISDVDYVVKSGEKREKKFYLIVSRLVRYKKVDLAIEAFNELGFPLVVVGTGSEEKKFKSKYKFKKNIIFKGFVTDEELVDLYKGAKAFVFPQEEDFGIAAVESQAAGTPVIAYKKGGSLDTVIDGKTGVFFEKQNKESLIKAVKRFEKMKFDRDVLIKNAERFSKERFKKEFKKIVEKHMNR
ncbi:MAG: Glycosyl transferase group 1 [Microgenomates group bacterium GW2011_GWC1_38_12]|nr:MAG: Glycosyl transferase group 1 [Microgenomates group bacterium GW2011_GWC1_38_12]